MGTHGVSIIVTSYNKGAFLNEAVDSVLKQPAQTPFEIVVVDDGSDSQQTIAALESLQDKKNITVERVGIRRGVQHARNVGLSVAAYPYVLMMDADDKLNLDSKTLKKGSYVDRAVSILSNNDDVAFVFCATRMFGTHSGFTNSSYPITEAHVLQKHHVSTWIVYRKDEAMRAGGYDLNIQKWQDWSFAIGLLSYRAKRGHENKITFLPEPYYLYRTHTGNRVSERRVHEFDEVLKTFSKHKEFFSAFYAPLPENEIPSAILSRKPSKVKDLLLMGAHRPLRTLETVFLRGLVLR